MSVDALSLACNIITVIDYGHKFYQSFRDIYENHKPDATAEANANDLLLSAETLKALRQKAQQSAPENDKLFQIADRCAKAATALHQEIAKLDLQGASSRIPHRLQSLLAASKRSWRRSRIEELKKSLDDCQHAMLHTVLLEMYKSGEADRVLRQKDFGKLDLRLQTFFHAVSDNELQLSQLLVGNRSLHQETQEVVRQEVAVLRRAQVSDAELSRLKVSLRFPGQNQRYHELEPAHSRSFDWLVGHSSEDTDDSNTFHSSTSGPNTLLLQYAVGSEEDYHEDEDEEPKYEPDYLRDLHDKTFGDFRRWLIDEPDSKLYWISGKPGAGKSTLMKFLFQQIEETNLIESPHLVIRHFFWLGTTSKRSKHNDLEGMLMTVLRQLLEHDLPTISLFTTLMQKIPRICVKEDSTEWSLGELEHATQEALQLLSGHFSIYLLLDALDEHLPAADHDELLRVVKQLENMPKVRLVVSSRRERIFERSLSSARQLQLERLTAPDIHRFALATLSSTMEFESSASRTFLNDTVETIVRKANGVFLWARLATGSIKRGINDENSIIELLDRLNDMPTELSDYFKFIWQRLGDDQKRYKTRAANLFLLLCCNPWNEELFKQVIPFGPWNHMTGRHNDLLCLGLALDPMYAQNIIQGDNAITKKELLSLCQSLEREIISSCAGLVELCEDSNETREVDYCIPCDAESTALSRRYTFIHRTAREFLQETEEGKDILLANDLGEYGPEFRVLLAALARSALFREPTQPPRCLPKRRLDLSEFFYEIGLVQRSQSPLNPTQRYLLLDMCHRVHYRFSGHPSNPIFQDWVLAYDSYSIYPFVTIAAYLQQGDYAAQWMNAETQGGRTFPTEMYAMVSKADLHTAWHMDNGHLLLFKSDPCFGSSDVINIALPVGCFCPERLQDFPYSTTEFYTLETMFQQLVIRLSQVVHYVVDDYLGKMLALVIKHLTDLVNSIGFDPFTAIPLTYLATGPPRLPGHGRQVAWHYPYFIMDRYQELDTECLATVHMIYETNPLWVMQYVARIFASVPEAEQSCHDLMEFVHLHSQNGRMIQKPRPIVLFKSVVNHDELERDRAVPILEMKKVPDASKFQLDDFDEDGCLTWPLQQMWQELETDVMGRPQIIELLIARKMWCSATEWNQLVESCDIHVLSEHVFARDSYGDYRSVLPPENCPTEQEVLSHLTMRLNF